MLYNFFHPIQPGKLKMLMLFAFLFDAGRYNASPIPGHPLGRAGGMTPVHVNAGHPQPVTDHDH